MLLDEKNNTQNFKTEFVFRFKDPYYAEQWIIPRGYNIQRLYCKFKFIVIGVCKRIRIRPIRAGYRFVPSTINNIYNTVITE